LSSNAEKNEPEAERPLVSGIAGPGRREMATAEGKHNLAAAFSR
jgi:hypothetical protein